MKFMKNKVVKLFHAHAYFLLLSAQSNNLECFEKSKHVLLESPSFNNEVNNDWWVCEDKPRLLLWFSHNRRFRLLVDTSKGMCIESYWSLRVKNIVLDPMSPALNFVRITYPLSLKLLLLGESEGSTALNFFNTITPYPPEDDFEKVLYYSEFFGVYILYFNLYHYND